MKEKAPGAETNTNITMKIGDTVLVSVVYRVDPTSDWEVAEGYEPWAGRISRLPKQSAINGNVFVQPDIPRGDPDLPSAEDEFATGHPRVCDVSPHPVTLENGVTVEIRHSVVPYEKPAEDASVPDAVQ